MGSLLYGAGMLLIIAWAVLYLGFEAGPVIHLLLLVGIAIGSFGVAESFRK
ncbi:MAG: hypothetical protein JNL60_05335 [Bacteroidia bacterium]|nr:hypothetical protein [Bacteroidia bacterium]